MAVITIVELSDGRTWHGQLPDEVRDYMRETFETLEQARARIAELETMIGHDPYFAGTYLFDGPVYVRPVGRGIVIDEASGLQLEDAVKQGHYRLRARFDPISEVSK